MSGEREELARIWETERRQMEQIRELDMEELQVEEVDEEDEDEDDPTLLRTGYGDGVTFNTSLPSLHTYLGEVDDTHGQRTFNFLDGGAILKLPMFYVEGVVLFPGSTLPLRVIQPSHIAAVEKALNQVDFPYTMGVVRVHREVHNGNLCLSFIGTTAEIRQFRRLEDDSWNVLTRGQQRFRLRRHFIDSDGVPCGEVQIVKEDQPALTPRDAFAQLASIKSCSVRMSEFSSRAVSIAKPCDGVLLDQNYGTTSPVSVESDMSAMDSSMYSFGSPSSGSPNKYAALDERSSDDEGNINEQVWMQKKYAHSGPSKAGSPVRFSKLGNIDCSDLNFSDSSPSTINHGGIDKQKRELSVNKSKQAFHAPMSFWPRWAYEMFDSYSLARNAADLWRQIIAKPNVDEFVRKPDLLSFHIASRIPVSESTRQNLLEIDGVSYRLRREIQLLKAFNLIRCRSCLSLVARRSDMVVMSIDGPLNAYANPHGFIHEIVTLQKASGLALIGSPSEEHSWFPGYAWTSASCSTCETPMGWLFTATKRNLLPKSFWGIRSSQVSDDTQSPQT